MMKILKSIRGVSLVEVLIALFITGVLSAAMFRIYINQHHAWMIQDSVIEMQQNARAAIGELTHYIRLTGFQLPNKLPPLQAYNTNPDTIIINYNGGTCNAPIEHAMPQPSAELRCDGHYVGCFFEGQEAYIFDPFAETGEFFTITHVQISSSHIQHNTTTLSKCYPKGSVILALDRVKFYIDRSDTLHPKLMVKFGSYAPQVYAEDITDLQFTYTLKNGAVTSTPTVAYDVREVGITVTARTQKRDIGLAGNPYRHETYASRVYLRNLGT
jgi:Tfp pilus assembly protein PilE